MKTATNIYIFNLALADTLVLLTLPFQGTDVLLGFWPFGNALCKTVIAIDYYNMFTSTFTLTAMSVDRYVAICHPIRALDVRTSSKAQAVNVAIWALASVVGIPVAIMGSAQVEDEGQWVAPALQRFAPWLGVAPPCPGTRPASPDPALIPPPPRPSLCLAPPMALTLSLSPQRSSVWWRSPPHRTTGAPCLLSASSSSPSSSPCSSFPSATAS